MVFKDRVTKGSCQMARGDVVVEMRRSIGQDAIAIGSRVNDGDDDIAWRCSKRSVCTGSASISRGPQQTSRVCYCGLTGSGAQFQLSSERGPLHGPALWCASFTSTGVNLQRSEGSVKNKSRAGTRSSNTGIQGAKGGRRGRRGS